MKVCIAQPDKNAVSETFLRVHEEMLLADVAVLYGRRPRLARDPLTDRLARLHFKVTRRLSGRSEVWEVTRLYVRLLRRLRPDAVLAEYGPMGVNIMGACAQLDIPLVVNFHGFDASDRPTLEKYRQLYPQLFEQASAIIAVSQAMRQRLIALGADASKVHYNPCSVACERFVGAGLSRSKPVFLAVGRMVPKKGPHLTIIAFSEALRHCPDAHLRMIGDGPLLGFCRELAARLNVEHAVTFLGAQPHSVVQQEVRQARAFVQHSVVAQSGDAEGTPVAVLEASASGLPVVSTRHEGIAEAVIDGVSGLLFDEHDVFGMAKGIEQIARDCELATRLGQAGRQHVLDHYTQERCVGRLWFIIKSCINGSPLVPADCCDGTVSAAPCHGKVEYSEQRLQTVDGSSKPLSGRTLRPGNPADDDSSIRFKREALHGMQSERRKAG